MACMLVCVLKVRWSRDVDVDVCLPAAVELAPAAAGRANGFCSG